MEFICAKSDIKWTLTSLWNCCSCHN